MTDPSTAGPEALPLTEADIAHFERRAFVQSCFIKSDPAKTQKLMLDNNISTKEMQSAMDYKTDAISWMRMNGFPDGFQGLKVWSDAEIDQYIEWQLPQIDPFGGGKTFAQRYAEDGFDPYKDKKMRADIQLVFDREERRQAANPLHVLPWKVQHD